MICQIKLIHLTEECKPTRTLDIKQFLKPTVSWNYVMLRESSSFILFMMWISHLYVMSDILIDNLNWVNMKSLDIFRYKRRTNAMCTTLLCLRGRPRPSRPCGPGTASRSPGAPSFTRISRWVSWGQGWEDDWVSTHQVHPSGQVIRKGVLPDIDSYSAFFDNSKLSKTALEEIIKKELVSDIYVCGIATDVCVGKKCFCDTENVPPVHFLH